MEFKQSVFADNMPDIERLKPTITDKPCFQDSDREQDGRIFLPETTVNPEHPEYTEIKVYSDSDRNYSDGPQWDEKYIPEEYNMGEEITNDSIEHNMGEDVLNDSPEYNEDGVRDLTEDEKQELKDKLGWSDDKFKKCTIDEDGVIHYKTDRCDLEGKTAENGVPYERKRIEINGVQIEGVFPVFDSAFDTRLDPDNYQSKAYAKECNANLKNTIESNPELRSKFTAEQIKDIEEGRTPTGYVWHHNEEPGKMQLVKREDHDRVIGGAAHTGGNSLWGAESVDKSKKGESF